MIHKTLVFSLFFSFNVASQKQNEESNTAFKSGEMSIDDMLKLPPSDSIILNKEMDIQANRVEYLKGKLVIAQLVEQINKLTTSSVKEKTKKKSKRSYVAPRILYTSLKVISIWMENDELIGLFNIGKTKIRLSIGEEYNGYSLVDITKTKASIKRPSGKVSVLSI